MQLFIPIRNYVAFFLTSYLLILNSIKIGPLNI